MPDYDWRTEIDKSLPSRRSESTAQADLYSGCYTGSYVLMNVMREKNTQHTRKDRMWGGEGPLEKVPAKLNFREKVIFGLDIRGRCFVRQ